MRLWCVAHQENHEMTGNEVERVIYYLDWARADVIVNGVGLPAAPDDDDIDHMLCPRDAIGLTYGEPGRPGPEHVEDCYERRVAADQAARGRGERLR